MREEIRIFALVFAAVFSAGILSHALLNSGSFLGRQDYITASIAERESKMENESEGLDQHKEERIVISLPEEVSETPVAENKKEGARGVSIKETKDLCGGIECGYTARICPDGFRDRCRNFCIPQTGKCTDCTPECEGHDVTQPAGQDAAGADGEEKAAADKGLPAQDKAAAKIAEVKYKSDGDDRLKENWNSEWVLIEGNGEVRGWTLSDEGGHVFIFPAGFVLSGSVRVHSGDGENTQADLYWNGGRRPIWNNDGDKATLKDGKGDVVDEYSY